ncbi:MAG TPA: hypothetical protein VFG83_07505, partial [Kofleriaceae bacterium]|nr:hypothetical protein [Kofleriaceae bacterium]
EAIGIDRHRMVRLFQSLSMTPAGATPYGPEKDVSDQALELRRALERRFATTVLYIGIGAFWREHRKLGGRALWVLPNGTDYRFTPDNHRLVDLGKLCPEHLAEPPVEIERSCHDELELSRKGTEIRLRAREVGNRAVRNRELWLDGGNAAALADALDACLRDETPATINHCNDTLSILASGPEPRPSYFIQNRRAAPCPHPGIFSLAIDAPSAANLASALHKSP